MKIEVFYTGLSWAWRAKVNGRITASAHGYNRSSDATRAFVQHCLGNTALGYGRLTPVQKTLASARIRERITVLKEE
jgi:hypothetical protein